MIEYDYETLYSKIEDGYGIQVKQFISGVSVNFKCSDKYSEMNPDDVAKIAVLCELIENIVNNKIPITVTMDYSNPKKKAKR